MKIIEKSRVDGMWTMIAENEAEERELLSGKYGLARKVRYNGRTTWAAKGDFARAVWERENLPIRVDIEDPAAVEDFVNRHLAGRQVEEFYWLLRQVAMENAGKAVACEDAHRLVRALTQGAPIAEIKAILGPAK